MIGGFPLEDGQDVEQHGEVEIFQSDDNGSEEADEEELDGDGDVDDQGQNSADEATKRDTGCNIVSRRSQTLAT